jgi:hypothetical protein
MRRWLAVGQVQDSDLLARREKTADRPAHSKFGVVGIWSNDQDVEHGMQGS